MRIHDRERARELAEAHVALNRIKRSNDAISSIIEVLSELPDFEMRWSVIDYLHRQLGARAEAIVPGPGEGQIRMIGTSLVVAALGIGAGSTTTDPHPAGERTLHLFSVKQAGVEYWKTRYWSMKKYARKQEIEKGHVLQLVTALRRKLHPPAPKTGVPSWFYRAIMCIHGRESSDWRYGAPGHGSNGFEGGLQFLNSTWLSSGGGRFAQHAYDASPSEQITVGYWLYKRSGFGPWPNTARACGVL